MRSVAQPVTDVNSTMDAELGKHDQRRVPDRQVIRLLKEQRQQKGTTVEHGACDNAEHDGNDVWWAAKRGQVDQRHANM